MDDTSPIFNPFPGLRPFGQDEKHLFFGRETQTMELLKLLRSFRFLAAVGPSGSGKSSLIRAGLIPALYGGTIAEAGSNWEVVVMRPGGDPIGNLARAMFDAGLYDSRELGVLDEEEWPIHVQATLMRSALGLVETVRYSTQGSKSSLLLVVDQFEEIFRFNRIQSDRQGQADAFVNLLLEASQQSEIPIYVVITMRSDFIGDCAQFRGLAQAVNAGHYLIPRLTRDQWRTAIEGPVRVGGGHITPRLVQRLLTDVADDPDQLPILQHALMRSWDHWAAKNDAQTPIDLVDYGATGGMDEALSRHADEVFNELPDNNHRLVAEKVFKALTEKGEDNRGIRRPTDFTHLRSIAEAKEDELRTVLDSYRRMGRTFIMPPEGEELTPQTVVDISHESLMRVWRRMNDWVEEEAQSARIFRRLSQTAVLWKEEKAGLYGNPDLDIALQWRSQNHPNSDWADQCGGGFDVAIEFLEKSQQAFEAETEAREAARRRELEQARALAEAERVRADEKSRATRRVSILAVVLVILVGIAVSLFWEARQNERTAFARELGATATSNLSDDPQRALAYAYLAVTDPDVPEQPEEQIQDVLRRSLFMARLRAQLDHTNIVDVHVNAAVISADGSMAVTASDDETARLWSTKNGKKVGTPVRHDAAVTSADFSPDGKFVVTAAGDGVCRLTETRAGGESDEFDLGAYAHVVKFSPNGQWIVAAGDSGQLNLWNTETRDVIDLVGHTNLYRVTTARFSGNGEWLVTGSDDRTARIWRVSDGQPVAVLRGHTGSVLDVEFSGDSQRVATAGDRTARLWATNGTQLAEFHHNGKVKGVAFSPDLDGQRSILLTACEDGLARLWKLSGSGPEVGTQTPVVLSGHFGTVHSAEFSPNGLFIVTAGEDKTARIWPRVSSDSNQSIAVLRGHTDQVIGAQFSMDSRYVLTGSWDNSARIWEMPVERVTDLSVQLATEMTAEPAAISSDGSRIGLVNEDEDVNLIHVWNTASPERKIDVRSSGTVTGLGFDRSGDVLVVLNGKVSADEVAVVWDLRGDSPVGASLPTRAGPEQATLALYGTLVGFAFSEGIIEVWDWEAQKILNTLKDAEIVSAGVVQFSPDGSWVAAANRGGNKLGVWNRTSSDVEECVAVTDLVAGARVISFSPDGESLIIGCGNGQTFLWHWSKNGDGPVPFPAGYSTPVTGAVFSSDGGLALTVSAADRSMQLWSTQTKTLLMEFRGHVSRVVAAAFDEDEQSILSLGENGLLLRHSCPELASDISELAAGRLRATPDLLRDVVARLEQDESKQ